MNYATTTTTNTYNQFSLSKPTVSIKDFIESNTLVAKTAVLLLVIFLFIILLRLGITFLSWYFTGSASTHLIDGMMDSKNMILFSQQPSANSKIIPRSVNQLDGIEFTWSVWMYINDLQYLAGQYKHVFHKGNEDINTQGLIEPNNGPGLYIDPNKNSLIVVMSTFNQINQQIEIPNIPINKWINCIIRCQNTTLDVYINGIIAQSVRLNGVPKQNYGNVYMSMNGGFSGYTSNLWYYNYALGTRNITQLVKDGPNIKMAGSTTMTMKNPNYLSLRWYFYGNRDQFNP